MRLLDLFSGRFGWSRAFAARGWECVGVDLVDTPEVPTFPAPGKIDFIQADVLLDITAEWVRQGRFDFICASSPCEEFSVWGQRHFHPNPPQPKLGIKLFNHTRDLCESSGVPFVMENVRSAQIFVGTAAHHCGSFYLWGSGVPPLVWQGISKGYSQVGTKRAAAGRGKKDPLIFLSPTERAARIATIPPELANSVAEYAERLVEQKAQ